jgi:hypothetical protein
VIKFVNDLQQVNVFLQVLWFPPPIKLIEDKECQGGSLLLSVKLTDTIGDLKAKVN